MPRIDYRDNDGSKVPGVTTVLGVLGLNKGALLGWAYKQGLAGVPLYEARDKAGDIGTLCHLMIQYDLLDKVYDTSNYPKDIVDKAENGFIAWLDWKRLVDFQLVESELSLVDNELKYGGTMDKVAIKNRLSITDFKTGKGPYLEQWCQLSGYKHLWDIHHPNEPIDGGCYLLLVNKEDAGFTYAHKIALDKHFEIFKHALAIYKLSKELK
jgi:hypothetical protein